MDHQHDSAARKSGARAAEIDPVACVEYIQANAAKFAKAKAERIYIEESLRSIKAIAMQDHADKPVNAQEREAYASEGYRVALAGLRQAVEAEEALRWKMIAAQAKVEVWRSMESSNRALDRSTR